MFGSIVEPPCAPARSYTRFDNAKEDGVGPSAAARQPLRPSMRMAYTARSLRKPAKRRSGYETRTWPRAFAIALLSFGSALLLAKYVPNFVPGLEHWTCPDYHTLRSAEEVQEKCQVFSPDYESYDQALEYLIVGYMLVVAMWFALFHSTSTRQLLRDGAYAQIVTHAGGKVIRAISVYTITAALEQIINEARLEDLLLPAYIWRSYALLRVCFSLLEGVEVELEEEVLKERLIGEHPVYRNQRMAVHNQLMTGLPAKDVLFESDVRVDQEGCDRDEVAMIVLNNVWYPFATITKMTVLAVMTARWSKLDMTASALAVSYFALSLGTSVLTGLAMIPRIAGALGIFSANLFKVGERVSFRSGGGEVIAGWVKRVTLLSVTLVDDNQWAVDVPNHLLRDYIVANLSRTPRCLVRVRFTCSSRCAPEQVDALIQHLRAWGGRYARADPAPHLSSNSRNRCHVLGFNANGFDCHWHLTLNPGEAPFQANHDMTLAVSRAARRLCIPLEFNTITVHGMDGIPLAPREEPGEFVDAGADSFKKKGDRGAGADANELLGGGEGAPGAPEWTPAHLALSVSPLDSGRVTHYM
ncbi:hypothetical protein T492DRAFT_513410 [Pavlovales sp. CCMP2436]|nr:hypothetical protein T492DRAFT_513410 [Pavlovales sp. CCMP2436]